MKCTITRDIFTDKSVTGILDLDGVFQCYVLEPPKIDTDMKPRAITAGRYHAKVMWSNRFEMVTPHILAVPGFTSIEWHHGNYPKDTDGCALVGQSRGPDCVLNSNAAFAALMVMLPPSFEVEYIDAPEQAISA
jgi:hypothetical protein